MGDLNYEALSTIALCPVKTWQRSVKEDIVVSDALSDVGRIVACTASYRPEEESLEKGRLHLGGSLEFTILYTEEGDPARLHSLGASVPIEELIQTDCPVPEGAQAQAQIRYEIENARAAILNSRKLRLSALLEAQVQLRTEQEQRVLVGASEEGLQLLMVKRPVRRRIFDRKEKTIARGLIPVQEQDPNIEEVLWWDSQLTKRRLRLAEDRVELQGEVRIGVLYRSANSSGPRFREAALSFQTTVEAPGVREGQEPQASFRIHRGYLHTAQDDDGEERLLETEIVIEADLQVYEETEGSLITDAYHIEKEAELRSEPCLLQRGLTSGETRFELLRAAELAQIEPDCRHILYTTGSARVDDCLVQKEELILEGALCAVVFYETEQAEKPGIACMTEWIPFRQTIPVTGACEGQRFRAEIWLESLRASLLDGHTLELRAEVCAACFGTEEESLLAITQLGLREIDRDAWEQLPSAALCFAAPEQPLWELAKRLHIPEEKMERLNDFTVLAVR